MKSLKIVICLAFLLSAACSAPGQPTAVLPASEILTQPSPSAMLPSVTPPSGVTPLPSVAPSLGVTPADLAGAYPDRPECIPASAVFETAQAIRVIDGDTIEVFLNGQAYPLRYIGIDTPEIKHPQKGLEVFGPEAAAQNESLVLGKQVVLVKDVSETDAFGRLLRYVFVDSLDGLFVNAELTRTGFARASRYPPDVACTEFLQAAEGQARSAQAGLWSPAVIAAALAQADAATASAATAEVTPSVGVTPIAGVTPGSRSGAGAPGGIEISAIFYNGSAGKNEPDEYVEIRNRGSVPLQLKDWSLEDKAHHRFVFPEFEIAPEQVCRIYTNQDHTEWCGFSFRFDESAIWNNGGDCAYLADSQGQAAAEYCYAPDK